MTKSTWLKAFLVGITSVVLVCTATLAFSQRGGDVGGGSSHGGDDGQWRSFGSGQSAVSPLIKSNQGSGTNTSINRGGGPRVANSVQRRVYYGWGGGYRGYPGYRYGSGCWNCGWRTGFGWSAAWAPSWYAPPYWSGYYPQPYIYPYSAAAQVAVNTQTLATHEQKIEANQQDIGANRQQIEENTDRFTALAEYYVKDQATLKFKVGSAMIAPEDMKQLERLAQTATSLKGYIIEVTGYADSTGSAALNTRLSGDRARAVIAVLVQQGSVPVRHIVAPGAMGEYGPAASNQTKEGRAENRRVEVKVLVNRGIAGR
jgi:outer membrane protein OmpA-like peptidoglycan-associated protein